MWENTHTSQFFGALYLKITQYWKNPQEPFQSQKLINVPYHLQPYKIQHKKNPLFKKTVHKKNKFTPFWEIALKKLLQIGNYVIYFKAMFYHKTVKGNYFYTVLSPK